MAISDTSYGRGDTVYSNGSHAPTQGQVDPTGYVERSLNKPSNSRSGLASAALDRLNNNDQQAQMPTPGVLPLGDIKFLTITPTGQLVPSTTDSTAPPPMLPNQPTQIPPQLDSMQPGSSNGPPPSGSLAQAALSRIMANGGGPQ